MLAAVLGESVRELAAKETATNDNNVLGAAGNSGKALKVSNIAVGRDALARLDRERLDERKLAGSATGGEQKLARKGEHHQ